MTFVRRLPAIAVGLALSLAALAQGVAQPLPGSGPPGAATDPAQWYVAVDGQPQGPMRRADLAQLIERRRLGGETLVWRQGLPAWTPLAGVAELSAPPAPAASPATPPTRDDRSYFVDEGGRPAGPLSRDEVARRVAAGSIGPDTLVWHSGMAGWAPLGTTELAAAFGGGQRARRPGAAAGPAESGGDPVSTMVGTWRARIMQPVDGLATPIPFEVTLVYHRGGTLSGTGSGQLDMRQRGIPQPVTLKMALDGTWSGTAVGPARLRLQTRVTMRMSVPELGMPEETQTSEETSTIEIVDRNTLRDEDGTVIRRVDG